MRKVLFILLPILICSCIGVSASFFQVDAINTWYPTLNKPVLTPPNIVFPIVWSIIYLCMGISVGLLILSDGVKRKMVLFLFIFQLFLNFLWSILFFYFENPLLGFIDILMLDIFVMYYIIKSYPINKTSSILFFPYILWIFFASYINGYILMNNAN